MPLDIGFASTVVFPSTIPAIPLRDIFESPGMLLDVFPSHPDAPWAAGVPATGATVPNLAAATASALTGQAQSALKPTYNQVLSPTLIERTAKGGLHHYSPVGAAATTGINLTMPTAVTDYVRANLGHQFFLGIWAHTTLGVASPPSAQAMSVLQTASKFGYNLLSTSGQIDGGTRFLSGAFEFGLSDFRTVGATRFAGLASPDATIGADAWTAARLWQARREAGGQILYRVALLDATVDGRSYSLLRQAWEDSRTATFGAGGVYNGDSWTAPV